MRAKKNIVLLMCLFAGLCLFPITAKAKSGVLQLTSETDSVTKGETITVVCRVTSEEAFTDTSFRLSYDDKILGFLSGGAKVSGGNGMLYVASTGNSEETYKKTFSLQFKAKKKGTTVIVPDGAVTVTDSEGSDFSMSSNRLAITVKKKGAGQPEATASPGTIPEVTPQPVLSSENRLKSLKVSAQNLSPDFSPETKEYTAAVDADTDILYFTYVPQDDKARVQIKGNEDLTVGTNHVTVSVTAENGSVCEYKIQVTKESREQTEAKEKDETSPDIGFSIRRTDGIIYLKNAYEFEVLNPDELKSIPAGYIQSTIELSGISLPAFTLEQDLDNNYLLLYLKGASGEKAIYQYDRTEQTIQKYTGTMTERVNHASVSDGKSTGSVSFHVLIGIIAVLIIIVLCMLITMLKMAIKKKKPEDLDF